PGSWYKVTNDETVNSQGPVSVVKATAESLNTAYTDLWHRVAYDSQNDSHPVTDMARAFGVNVGSYPGGAGMTGKNPMQDQAGIALGQASLTVEEQATLMATLADNGVYHAPHVVARIIQGNAVRTANPVTRQVLTPEQAADVNYAMSFDTSSFGTAAGLGLTNGQKIIAKTGTTNLSQEAFFLGATPMDAMAVGMFVSHTGCTLPVSEQALCKSTNALSFTPPPGLQTLYGVGGLAGYGGQWPAQIWHTYFMNQFNTLPVQLWAPVNNWGTPWNLFGKLPPKPKPHPSHFPTPGGRPTCHGNGRHNGCLPTSFTPTPTPSPTQSTQCGGFVNPCPSPSPGSTKPGG
ncbi:MAG TPA: penicillin-binding transpeptidase domain-containing protein, partial [Streptosporangiaceae bacterium]|nr:penicillin-binding transpeptidase domain-containing protein [Streptosporangiaceae bacterium]